MRIGRAWLGAEVFTGALVVLIAIAVTDAGFVFVAVQPLLILGTVGAIHQLVSTGGGTMTDGRGPSGQDAVGGGHE